MRLFNLYTEDDTRLSDLARHAHKAFGVARSVPNPKEIKVKRIIQSVFEEVWGEYHDNPKILARLESFKHSMMQFVPDLIKKDEASVRSKVESLFRQRALGS